MNLLYELTVILKVTGGNLRGQLKSAMWHDTINVYKAQGEEERTF